MPINWRQRAAVIRVLAAVYAELGGETFKGRYGRIAKLYGNDATYDSIKSFFAKEVVRMAEDLKAGNLNGGDGCNQAVFGKRSGTMRRPLRLDLDDTDDEIVVMGERRLQMQQQSSQQERVAIDGKAPSESLNDGFDFNSPPLDSNRANLASSGHPASAMPRPSIQRQTREAGSREQATSRKRTHSTLQEFDDTPPSFGYVTNRGKHRCALCTTELSSAEILEKHESMDKLHLANLKDPVIVSRACTTLAKACNLAANASRRQNQRDREPLMSGAVGERNVPLSEQQSVQRRNSSTPHRRAESMLGEHEQDGAQDTIHVADGHAREVGQPRRQSDGNVDNREGETGPIPDVGATRQSATDAGMCPAQTVPRDAFGLPTPQLRTGASEDSAVHQQRPTMDLPNYSAANDRVEDVTPTLLAQFLSGGMKLLAKKCIEEHPELRVEFYERVKEVQRTVGESSVGKARE